MQSIPATDALVMAAAVADFRPEHTADQKIKKGSGGLDIKLTPTTDILFTVGQQRRQSNYPRVLIGFAAETQDLLNNAQSKLERKNADYIVANDVSRSNTGFQADSNIVTILGADGSSVSLPQQSKALVGKAIIDLIAKKLRA
jgi:phosphopantothenoylcysteine decarboxylase / phosphopantothenate---cysteine ligase